MTLLCLPAVTTKNTKKLVIGRAKGIKNTIAEVYV